MGRVKQQLSSRPVAFEMLVALSSRQLETQVPSSEANCDRKSVTSTRGDGYPGDSINAPEQRGGPRAEPPEIQARESQVGERASPRAFVKQR